MEIVERLRQVLAEDPRDERALESFGDLLTQVDRTEGLRRWSRAFAQDQKSLVWLQEVVAKAMQNGRLERAGRGAELYALLRWGGEDLSEFHHAGTAAPETLPTPPQLTLPKLRHDIEQLGYLRRHGVLDAGLFSELQSRYEATAARLEQRGAERLPLDEEDQKQIGRYYNRVVHLRQTPRVAKALSPSWDRSGVQRAYRERENGVVVIDDFLTAEALHTLRAFCLESTIWFANRYAHGRLGAFLHDGFTCPLLMQVAEELKRELPQIYLPQYPLTQVWAFKNTQFLPADSTTHADFAAVTTNLWITPDSANTLPERGGLTIHNVDAPLHWDFATYNGRSDVISPFLRSQGASAINIPHRQNRTVIFNADLFHGTQEVRFSPGYENHRINVSWLFGRREDDVHHPVVHAPVAAYRRVRPWRSAALRQVR